MTPTPVPGGSTPARVVVVGAGLGGLAAACHLRGAGLEVVVLEREDRPGGRVGALARDGFRLDTGATVLTMPGLLAETFAAVGADLAGHLRVHALDPMYRATFADGSEIQVRAGRDAMREEIRTTSGPADARAFDEFCDWLTSLHDVEMPSFIDRNFSSPLALAWPPAPLVRLVRLGGLRRVSSVVASRFRDERLRRLFSFQTLYAGLSPYDALAVFSVITYMDTVAGVHFPEGGMGAIPDAMAGAATKAGVDIRCSTPVERVLRRGDGSARGVRLESGETVDADAVVVNAELSDAYERLLPGLEPPRALRRGRFSPSCLLWVAGVRGTPPPRARHHNVHFGAPWREAFDALGRGERMPDPSLLVSIASSSDPSLAPPGAWTAYVLEPVPNLDGRVDWDEQAARATAELRARVQTLGYDVGDVVTEQIYDPRAWAAKGLARGTPFGLAHRFFQSGPFRPANHDRRAPGVFFAGSSTVPGVGVPMVLLSGRLAASRVVDWLAKR